MQSPNGSFGEKCSIGGAGWGAGWWWGGEKAIAREEPEGLCPKPVRSMSETFGGPSLASP